MTQIRVAAAADLAAICDLADEINWQHHRRSPAVFIEPAGQQTDAAFWQMACEAQDGVVLVAQQGGAVVGFVTAKLAGPAAIPFLRTRQVCRIGTIVVTEALHGRGIGQQLIAAVEAWARECKAEEIRLEVFDFNRRAIDFYAAAGYGVQSHILCKPMEIS